MGNLTGASMLFVISAACFFVAKNRRARVFLSSARVANFVRGGRAADKAEIEGGARVGGVFTFAWGLFYLLMSLNG